MTYISTSSLTSPMRSYVLQAQSALSQAQTEVATGAPADVGLTLGAQTGTMLSLQSQVDQLNGFTSGNNIAGTRLSATANALQTMLTSAQNISAALITASSAGGNTGTLGAGATSALQNLASELNTSVGGESIFGGINSSASPIADYFSSTPSAAKQAVDTSFAAYQTAQGVSDPSKLTGTEMQSYLSNQFGALFSDANWQGTWSSASTTTMQTTVSPTQTVSTSLSANNTAFRQITQAYTMLSEFSGSNLGSDARAALVSTASSLMNAGIASLTALQGTVGTAQSSVTNANSQITAQVSVLQTNVGSLDSVDTYALSNKITTLQTQLEASYELTSRLQSLSLTNYLTS